MPDVPVDAQGSKTDPTGRGIDDFLRSILPGSLDQSTVAPPAQTIGIDGPPATVATNPGIQSFPLADIAPVPSNPLASAVPPVRPQPPVADTNNIDVDAPIASAIPNVPSGDPFTELDNLGAVGGPNPIGQLGANLQPSENPLDLLAILQLIAGRQQGSNF